MRFIAFFSAIFLCSGAIAHQSVQGIIYLQGDNKLPIYVKLDGIMQKRYGLNHCIMTGITPGQHEIEVLFQQNKHKPVHFNVAVVEDSPRTYLLYEKESTYILYDLNSKNYIQPIKNEK